MARCHCSWEPNAVPKCLDSLIKGETMSNTKSINNLFDTLFRDAIGFDRLASLVDVDVVKYPPHNVTKVDEDQYTIEVAAAGFSKDELDVSVHKSILTIKGTRKVQKTESVSECWSILYRGIAQRDFERSFKLDEYVEVTGVKYENGLLTVSLARNVPEEKKARSFKID